MDEGERRFRVQAEASELAKKEFDILNKGIDSSINQYNPGLNQTPETTGGLKYDAEKERPSLILQDMSNAILGVIRVAEFGTRKYAPGNWLFVADAEKRYLDALLRHLLYKLRGDKFDIDSGLELSAHIVWNALALYELELRRLETLSMEEKE